MAAQTGGGATAGLFYIQGDYFGPSCFKYYWPCSFPYISLHGASTLICSRSEITGAHRRTSLSLTSKILRHAAAAALAKALASLRDEACGASAHHLVLKSFLRIKPKLLLIPYYTQCVIHRHSNVEPADQITSLLDLYSSFCAVATTNVEDKETHGTGYMELCGFQISR